MPIDSAAFSYQPEDRKSVRRVARKRFLFLEREPIDLRPPLDNAFRFKLVSLGEKAPFSWRHRHQTNTGLLRQAASAGMVRNIRP
jgi:hypothetical protein